jgi:hypothetical protein
MDGHGVWDDNEGDDECRGSLEVCVGNAQVLLE